MPLVRRLARPLLAASYVYNGLDAVRHPQDKVANAKPVLDVLGPKLGLSSLNADPAQLIRLNGATHVAAGSLLALGKLPRLSALVLAVSSIPTIWADNAFWRASPSEKPQVTHEFFKSLSAMGGLWLAAVDTSGKPSVGYRAKRAAKLAKKAGGSAAHSAKEHLPG
ncbi:MAG: DoxX family protein [Actinomycetales bacterium]